MLHIFEKNAYTSGTQILAIFRQVHKCSLPNWSIHLLAKLGFDTAENELPKVWYKGFTIYLYLAWFLIYSSGLGERMPRLRRGRHPRTVAHLPGPLEPREQRYGGVHGFVRVQRRARQEDGRYVAESGRRPSAAAS